MKSQAVENPALVTVEVPRREGYVVRVGLHRPDAWNPAPYVDLRMWTVWRDAAWKVQQGGAPTRKGVTVDMANLRAFKAAVDRIVVEAEAAGLLAPEDAS